MASEATRYSAQWECREAIHELNNALGIILAECDLLELAEHADAATRINTIKTAAREMANKIARFR